MRGFAPIRPRFSVSALALAAFTAAAAAASDRVDLVPYVIVGNSISAPLTGSRGDPARGRAIVADHRLGLCLLCHSGPFPADHFQGNIGPPLDGAGSRWSEGQLRLRIVDASRINPATIMPPFYRVAGLVRVPQRLRGKPVFTAMEVEDVVAYLMTLK